MDEPTFKLPFSDDAELTVLGGCMAFGARCTLGVFAELTESDFFRDDNQAIARVVKRLAEENLPTDGANVGLKWAEYGLGPRPDKAIAKALDHAVSEDLALATAKDVAKDARRRAMILAAAKSLESLQDPSKDEGEALGEMLNTQATFRDVSYYTSGELARTLLDKTQEKFDTKGQLQGIATGYRSLDRKTEGLQKGELFVIGARPSQGKSAIALNIASNIVFVERKPVLFVSLEMSAYSLARRMAACRGNCNLSALRSGEFSEYEFQRFNAFVVELKKAPFHIVYSPGIDIGRLSMIIRQYSIQHGVEVVVVDYLQKVRGVGRHEKKTYEIASVSGGLKDAAVKCNVSVVAPCQLNRGPEQDGNRSPRLSDLADSGQIERDADTVCMIHFCNRADKPEDATLILGKQRDGETAALPLRWNPSFVRFEEVSPISDDDVPPMDVPDYLN